VGEDVGSAVVRGDESEALVRVEPLHDTSNHVRLLDGRSFPAIMDGNEGDKTHGFAGLVLSY
jgi:hypothetical protein